MPEKLNQKNVLNETQVPPHSADLEKAVLGSIIMAQMALIQILPVLRTNVFYIPKHQLICDAILSLTKKNQNVDILTVSEELKKLGTIDDVGGTFYLLDITTNLYSSHNVDQHYHILLEYYYKRELISIGQQAAIKGFDSTQDVFELFEWINSELEEINSSIGASAFSNVDKVFVETMEIIDNKTTKVTFYPIDDPGIDNILMLSPSNLLNISGKSGSGKTTLTAHMAFSLLKKYKKKIAICWYTMEDSPSKILMNYISPSMKLTNAQMHGKNYNLSVKEKEKIKSESKNFLDFDIEFFSKPAFIGHIKTHFQRFCTNRPNKFNILIIDNVMLLKDNHQYRFKGKGTDVDDHIANQIQDIFTQTKADYDINVWFIHHLTKEQLAKSNFIEGYRPREDQIKGSTRYRDVCTQGILINRPVEFPDIVKHYKETEYQEAIKYLMIGEVYKNRDGNTGFFRYFANLDYKIFFPI